MTRYEIRCAETQEARATGQSETESTTQQESNEKNQHRNTFKYSKFFSKRSSIQRSPHTAQTPTRSRTNTQKVKLRDQPELPTDGKSLPSWGSSTLSFFFFALAQVVCLSFALSFYLFLIYSLLFPRSCSFLLTFFHSCSFCFCYFLSPTPSSHLVSLPAFPHTKDYFVLY